MSKELVSWMRWFLDNVNDKGDFRWVKMSEAADEIESLRQQLAALTTQCEKVVKWKHLMSYNDSYFGEPAGELKRVVYEIDRSMPIRGDK